MKPAYKSNIKIFEDFFDSEEVSTTVSDISGSGSDPYKDSEYTPKYQLCWFPPYGLTLYPLSLLTIRKLHFLMDSMRYIRNLQIFVTGYGIDDPKSVSSQSSEMVEREFFECSEECPPVAAGSPMAEVVQLKFDYDERRSGSVSYMLNVLCDVMVFFRKFGIILKMPTEYQIQYLNITYMPDDLDDSDERRNSSYNRMNATTDYRKLKMLNMTYFEVEKVVKLLEHIGSSVTKDDLVNYQDFVNPRSSSLMTALLNQNVSKNLIHKLDIDETSLKKSKTLIIRVPEGSEFRLKNLSLSILKEDAKKDKIELLVDGTLIINSFDEFANLKFLKMGYEHNKLKVQTLMTPKMLKYLLVSAYFKELDLTHADFTEEISVDLSFKYVTNHEIKISSNNQLEIKNSNA